MERLVPGRPDSEHWLYLIRFTDHATWRAGRRGVDLAAAEAIVLDLHATRLRNTGGAAEWRLDGRGVVVLYDWPTGDDRGVALVRSVWRR